jgi:hypothetical protein
MTKASLEGEPSKALILGFGEIEDHRSRIRLRRRIGSDRWRGEIGVVRDTRFFNEHEAIVPSIGPCHSGQDAKMDLWDLEFELVWNGGFLQDLNLGSGIREIPDGALDW